MSNAERLIAATGFTDFPGQEQSAVIANHAQGRVPTSRHAEAYRTRHNRKKAAEIMLRMQVADGGVSNEVTK